MRLSDAREGQVAVGALSPDAAASRGPVAGRSLRLQVVRYYLTRRVVQITTPPKPCEHSGWLFRPISAIYGAFVRSTGLNLFQPFRGTSCVDRSALV